MTMQCISCAWVAHKWAGAQVFVFKNLLKSEMIKASSQEPEQVTKPGFPIATHKPTAVVSTSEESKASHIKHQSMLVIFSDCWGTVQEESIPPHQMVKLHCYCEILQCLRKQVHWKCLEWLQNQEWLIHLHNALAHTAPSVQQISSDKDTFVVPYSPYSPKLAPYDFLLFMTIKQKLWELHFQGVPKIHHCQHIPRKAVPNVQKFWSWWTNLEGDYFKTYARTLLSSQSVSCVKNADDFL